MKKKWLVLISLTLALTAPARPAAALQGDEDIAVIVNPGNPASALTAAELRRIFMGEKQSWSGGEPVALFVRAPKAVERDVLLRAVLHMSQSQYDEYWVKRVFNGQAAHEPLALLSNGMQLEAVRSFKGGIALIAMRDLKDGVKVLKIDGALPGTAGYSLK